MKPSHVDNLAQHLSEHIGAQVTVLRQRIGKRMVYQISIVREGHGMLIGATHLMNVGEAKTWLATLCDIVTRGFILAMPSSATIDEMLLLIKHWETVRTALVLMDH